MEVLNKKKAVLLLILTIIIAIAAGTFMIIDNVKIWKLNDAIEIGDRNGIEKWINRLSKSEIDAVKINHPLNKASFRGDVDTVILLVEKGIDINSPRDKLGNTPLLSALSSRNTNRCTIANYLIEHGADVNAKNQYGETALTCLIYQSEKTRDESMVLFRNLYKLSDIASMFPNSYMKSETALEMVASEDMPELVDWLIKENGYEYFDIPHTENGSYLHQYYKVIDNEYVFRAIRMTEYIINNNLEDIDSKNKEGRTVLSEAAEMNEVEDCKLFLSLGANPSIKDNNGKTAYDYALEKGNTEVAELIKKDMEQAVIIHLPEQRGELPSIEKHILSRNYGIILALRLAYEIEKAHSQYGTSLE